MKGLLKNSLALALALTMVFGAAPLAGLVGLELPEFNIFGTKAEAATYSGTCGDNLTWTLDDETGVLEINGTGAMTNYFSSSGAPWYNYRLSIKTITIGNGVTSIGVFAFSSCDGLTSVTIPNNVTSIGRQAFCFCDGLTSITVDVNNPNYSSDEYGVLFNKDKAELIQYPVGNKRTEYKIPDSVTSIGDDAFFDCTGLTSITIPDSVTSIGNYAFAYCYGLTSVIIGNGVTSIGDYAFDDCDGLTSITIPDSVTSIDRCAFYGCTGLTSVTIGNGVTSIGDEAFYYCTGLTSVSIPDSVTIIGEDAFYNTGIYNDSTNWENGVLYIGNYLIEAKTTISGDYTIKTGTKVLANSAFYDCTGLTSVSIPDSVTSIGSSAFYGCTSLTDVYYAGTEDEWNAIRIYFENSYLTNANIHYNSNSGGETPEPSEKGECNISQDIVFLEKGEHYFFVVYDKYGNDITNEVTWSSITSVDQTGKVEIVRPGDIQAVNEGLTTVHANYWNEDKTKVIGYDICKVYVGKPNELKYTYIYDTEYYYGGGGFYSNALGISNTVDVYLKLNNKLRDNISFLSQYDKYNDELSELDLASLKITATVSGNDLSFSDSGYVNTYSETFDNIPVGKSVDDLLMLYPYNFSVGSNKKTYTLSVKIESEDFETITETYSFNVSALQYRKVNEHIDFVNNNTTYGAFKTKDFASSMLSLKNDAQYVWAKYTTFDFENYYDVLFADILVDLLKVSQFDNISFLPVVKEWVDNYETILSAVSTMVEDDYTGYLKVTENAIDKLLKKSKFSDEGIYNDDELYQTVLDIIGNASNADKITKVFATMDKTKQVGGFVKLGVNIINDIIDSVNSISVINAYKDLTDNNFKVVIQKLYNSIPDSEKQAKKAVYRYINLDTAGGYTEEMFNQVLSVAGNMTIDVFKSVYKKQVVSLLCNAVGKIPIGNGAVLSSTPAFAGVSTAFGAFATGASLGLCISDILCNNSGQSEKMGKVVAAAVYAPYVINTLDYFENNMKTQKTATALSQFEYAFNLHKAVQIYSLKNTYDALEIQANSVVIKMFSNRDYPGAMSDVAALKSMFENCNCCNPTVSGRAGTKTIEIKCPVDVYIYDENGTEVVRIINNITEFVANGITVFINGSQKYVTVPADQEYSIKIIATDGGKMTYSVVEYDTTAQRKRVVKNENIALTKGALFTGKVNENLNSSDESYALISGEKTILPTQSFDVTETDTEFPTLSIRKSSAITIDYGDSIILHADIDGTLPEGARIEWTADNGNFSMSVSADGTTCKISPKSNGKTVFTATVYDKDGNVISSDTQEMTAKAGLWQKIVAFFKKIFGLTKTFPEAFKGIF